MYHASKTTTPYESPRTCATEDPRSIPLQFAPFRSWYVIAACVPFVLPYLFDVCYKPIDRSWTVKTLGCSCPNLDGTYRAFTANHFNAIVWMGVFTISAYLWFRFCRRIVLNRPPLGLVLAPMFVVGFICFRHFALGIWL